GGQLIRRFGEFVAGNHLVVGMLIFLILVSVQFLVITNGATRISEVAARFALDGMPGRQLAVDSDINAGLISSEEARQRRLEIMAEADFYGSMDGASKFVRGDAVAGLVIMAINLAGGLAIGVGAGMGLAESGSLYSKLTIGDGLVSQIPALLISLSAGILVSRSAQSSELPQQVVQQLTARPEALAVAAVFLLALISARLPAAPLLTLGAACAGVAFLSRPAEESEKLKSATTSGGASATKSGGAPASGLASSASAGSLASSATSSAKPESSGRHAELLRVDPLTLELGTNLLKLASPSAGDSLLAHISFLREHLAAELGLLLPRVRVRDNPLLERNQYRIIMSGAAVARGALRPAMKLATVQGDYGDIVGEETRDPVTGEVAWWIPPSTEAELRRQGFAIRSPIEALMDHFQLVARQHAPELLTRDTTRELLDQISTTAPAACEELSSGRIGLGELQRTLQTLLAEGVSIRPLGRILEALSDAVSQDLDEEQRHRYIRRRLGRLLVSPLCDDAGRLPVVILPTEWEEQVARSEPLAREQLNELRRALAGGSQAALTTALVVSDERSTEVRNWARRQLPRTPLLTLSEIPPDIPLAARSLAEPVGRVRTELGEPEALFDTAMKLYPGAA
ncbi:MAG: FHIPEP family type III secretion protein, partial [Planctomycetales bacterium]|nr:FHIPEP family type III secretion protein [Planctomycetales bacterium]